MLSGKKKHLRGLIKQERLKHTVTESNVKQHNDVNKGRVSPELLSFDEKRELFDNTTNSEASTIMPVKKKEVVV